MIEKSMFILGPAVAAALVEVAVVVVDDRADRFKFQIFNVLSLEPETIYSLEGIIANDVT